MALADLEADLRTIPRRPATFATWLNAANPEEAALVRSYLEDVNVPVEPLVRKLRAHDIPITSETVRAYRDAR